MSGQDQTQARHRAPTPAARRRRRERLFAGAVALAAHVAVISALLSTSPHPPHAWESPPMTVELVTFPPPPPPAPPLPEAPAEAPAAPAPAPAPPKPEPPKPAAKPPPPQRLARAPVPPEVPPRLVPPEPVKPAPEVQVSAAELASAMTAGSEAAGEGGDMGLGGGGAGAGGGGRCDMIRRLQRALRRDAQVQAAIAQAHRAPGSAGRPIVVWNGDWVRRGEEDGKGLAGVRQAIAVEVAFAPKPCRTQPMHGLVLLSLNDSPGSARLVLGAGAWRWSDLLFAR